MTSFKAVVLDVISEAEHSLSQTPMTLERASEIRSALRGASEAIEGYIKRSEREDSPYGSLMKDKIRNAAGALQRLEQEYDELKLKLRNEHNFVVENLRENSEPEFVSSLPLSPDAAKADEVTGSGESLTLDPTKVIEAASRLKIQDGKLRAAEKERQKIAAEAEKKIREEISSRQRADVARQREIRLEKYHELRRVIKFASVNPIFGAADYESKLGLLGQRACVIDWFADWCGPCRMMSPIYSRLSQTYSEVAFFSVDTEHSANKAFAQMKGIRALPTFHLLVAGKIVKVFQGADPSGLEVEIRRISEATESVVLEETLLLSGGDELEPENLSSLGPPQAASKSIIKGEIRKAEFNPSKPIQVKLVASKNRFIATVDTTLGSSLENFIVAARESLRLPRLSRIVLAFNGMLLDDRRYGEKLYSLGLADGCTIRIVMGDAKIEVNLRFNELTQVIHESMNAPFYRIRHAARLLTKTSSPKIIFLGKVLPEEADLATLSSLRIEEKSTLLCLPFGEPYSQTGTNSCNIGAEVSVDEGMYDLRSETDVVETSSTSSVTGGLDAGVQDMRFLPRTRVWMTVETEFLLSDVSQGLSKIERAWLIQNGTLRKNLPSSANPRTRATLDVD